MLGNGMGNMGNGMMANPPMPRMTPPRQISPPRPQYLPGRFINSEADITPGEILMDGSISFFCTNDLSRIIIKQWNAQGTIDTMTYVAERPQPAEAVQQVQQNQQPQMPDPPPPPNQQQAQPDLNVTAIKALTDSIEGAFNNLASNIQQGMQALSDKLDNWEGGRG